ncbi:MAG: RNA methyltransferase [Candidatus Jordarchaeaceae archaeon]
MVNLLKIKVVFLEPENAGNVGAIARAMKNFELKELVLVNPKYNDMLEAEIRTMHGIDVLKNMNIVNTLEDAFSDVDFVVGTTAKTGMNYNVLRTTITPDSLVGRLRNVNGKIALLFGRESIGLTNEELEKADVVVTIPASSYYPTLNVSHAAAIIFYEIYKSQAHRKRYAPRSSSKLEKEKALEYFSLILKDINYPAFKSRIAERVFRNVISRAFISGREVYTLIGVLRRIHSFLSLKIT